MFKKKVKIDGVNENKKQMNLKASFPNLDIERCPQDEVTRFKYLRV